MKEELRKQWTAALRSGAYRQGTEYLCSNGRYCCLGVLAEIYNKDQPLEEQQSMGDTVLDGHICDQVGLRTTSGQLFDTDSGISLASLNDGMWLNTREIERLRQTCKVFTNVKPKLTTEHQPRSEYWQLSFDQIADLIEERGDHL